MQEDHKKIKNASWVSIFGNALLSVLKLVVGFVSGSMAVIADGIDSASDILASVVTLIAARIISKPPDPQFPFGYAKADSIAAKVLSFIIFFAGAQLAITTITSLVENVAREIPSMIAIYVTVFSIAGKLGLSWYQFRIGKSTESHMLQANAKNMQNDVLISGSVLLGLIFTYIFKLPVLDTITGLLVSVYIMYTAFKIFMKTNIELMDGIEDKGVYEDIFAAVDSVKGAHKPHRVRIRQMGKYYMIDIDIEVNGEISVKESHQIAQNVEDSIRNKIKNVYDVLVHVEPYGKDHKEEMFGVSREHMK